MVAVAVRELEKRFGDVVVLDRVSLDVPDGCFAVLVGPSGCGKSTLLRLLAGLEEPTSGRIEFGDRDVTRLPPRERDVAMVFQSYALYPHLSVRDNLAFGLKLRKTDRSRIERRVDEVSAMLGLDQLLERMPRELSGGQRQRVAMGRAIVRRPSLFMFDEPLSNLDAALRAQVRVDIRKLHQKLATTSIYVTHDQVEAMTLADVMFVINQGHVEQSGAPLEVYHRPATRFVASFLGSPSMNFLPGTVVSVSAAELSVAVGAGDDLQRLTLDPGEFDDRLEEGREVTVGIRPHDIAPVTEGHGAERVGTLPFHVNLTEALGGETYAYGEVCGHDVVVRLDPSCAAEAGERLEVAPTAVQLFDVENGHTLRS
jgi:sn-glycerol 3-phosphate transport system ATP-binding protein/multiple sugar transport system ATP-binding protein